MTKKELLKVPLNNLTLIMDNKMARIKIKCKKHFNRMS